MGNEIFELINSKMESQKQKCSEGEMRMENILIQFKNVCFGLFESILNGIFIPSNSKQSPIKMSYD